MGYKASESAKNDAYERGYEDGQSGVFSPPKGDGFVDAIFAPIDWLAGGASTREHADATAEAYRQGHSAAKDE